MINRKRDAIKIISRNNKSGLQVSFKLIYLHRYFMKNFTQPNLSLLISKLNNSQKLKKKLNKTAGFRQHQTNLNFSSLSKN
jgi:hypothetical protein